MAKDKNQARKDIIAKRAAKSKNKRVARYATNDLFEKMDQAGDHAGAWLESLEANFDVLTGKPQGALRSFKEQDFDVLFSVMFGYERDERGTEV